MTDTGAVDDVTARRLVSDYLSRLQAAAWVLPAPRRSALLERVRSDLDDGLGRDRSEAAVRAALLDLGEPSELVAAETAAEPLPEPPPPRRGRSSGWESRQVAAVLLLGVGGFALPIFGPLVGLVVTWTAPGWSRLQKGVATALAVGTPAVVALVTRPTSAGGWGYLAVVLILPLGGLVPAGYLAWTVRRAARAAGSAGSPDGHGGGNGG